MSLEAGSRLGAYEVLAKIGEGGMGEVYKARDTRLDRTVAIKVLSAAVASDPHFHQRFDREARIVSQLSHPHICTLHDVGEAGASPYLVMEYLPGRTLADRLAEGALRVDEAIAIAVQIASALAAAHRAGIVHRDLKPGNVMLVQGSSRSGAPLVKLLDFGLAKISTAVAVGEGSFAQTMTRAPATAAGTILGTLHYMSPEQIEGRDADGRSDIFAFGAILYEMIAGRRAFDGASPASVIGAILKDQPASLTAPTTAVSPLLDSTVTRCLAKRPDDRWQSIDDVAIALAWVQQKLETDQPVAGVATRSRSMRWTPAAFVVSVAVALATGWLASRLIGGERQRGATAPVTVAQIAAPPGVISAFHDGFALSPDGATLAFTARESNGTRQIWLRRLDALTARPLEGTTNGMYPFWSPDGANVAFFADGILKRVAAGGGSVQTICATPGQYLTGSWGDSGEILFSNFLGANSHVLKVSASGGTPTPIRERARGPQWLPGEKRYLFVDFKSGAVQRASIDDASAQTVLSLDVRSMAPLDSAAVNAMNFVYEPSGYLFANRGGALTIQRIDRRTMTAIGSPQAISGPAGTPKVWFAVSSAANRLVALAYGQAPEAGDPGDPLARLRLVDRNGASLGDVGQPGRFWAHRFAPDGRRVAANTGDAQWILGDPRPTRLRDDGYAAVWSPDGTELVLHGVNGHRRKRLDRDVPEVALSGLQIDDLATDWSPDGRLLLVTRNGNQDATSEDIITYDVNTGAKRDVVATSANEWAGRFSPDGHRIAYTSNAAGQQDIYLRDVSDTTVVPTLIGSGIHPSWRRDGRELFYLGPNDEMMAVAMTPRGEPSGAPRQLFRIPVNDITRGFTSPYDVTPDGQRFLLNIPEAPEPLLYISGLEQFLRGK